MSIDVFPSTVLNATLWNGESLPLSVTGGGTGATTAAQARTNLGLGTMAQQDANAVAITGGSATFTGGLTASGGNTILDGSTLVVDVGNHRVNINPAGGTAPGLDCVPRAYFRASVGVQTPAASNTGLGVKYARASQYGMTVGASDSDTGGNAAIQFLNMASGGIGSITLTATATAYNTSSDTRLKSAITALTGALAVVQALRPVAFRWNANDEQGHGFLAHELQQVIPDAVTGEPDAVNEDGSVKPQQVDHSKLVVWLVSAVQELAARVVSLEEQLGV